MFINSRWNVVIKCVLLFVVMAIVAQWMVLKLYLTSLGQKQEALTEVIDSPLISLIYEKTGVKLDFFQIIASDRPYAVMFGIPNKPYMMLSSKLNATFNDSEKEYVVLHEIGHYVLNHTIKEVIFFLILFIIGCFIVRMRKLYVIPIVGIIFGLLYIQYGMVSEKEADRFAVTHITDPNGMITSTEKFRSAHYPPLDDYSIFWSLLYRSNPYHVRIEMAKEEILKRM